MAASFGKERVLSLLASETLSASDKAGVIGLAVAVLIFGAGYIYGFAQGARKQRKDAQRHVPTLFTIPTPKDRY